MVITIFLVFYMIIDTISKYINLHPKTTKLYKKYVDTPKLLKQEIKERITYLNCTPAKIKHSYKKQTRLMIKVLKLIYKERYLEFSEILDNNFKKLKEHIYYW